MGAGCAGGYDSAQLPPHLSNLNYYLMAQGAMTALHVLVERQASNCTSRAECDALPGGLRTRTLVFVAGRFTSLAASASASSAQQDTSAVQEAGGRTTAI